MAAVCREARLLLHGIAVGAILMAVYDILRFLRPVPRVFMFLTSFLLP